MNRKVYCSCDSDFSNHYRTQAGSGYDEIPIFKGQPYQRGYGFGSLVRRFGVPLLRFFGKELLRTGINVGTDLLSDVKLRDSIRTRGVEGIQQAAKRGLSEISKAFDQSGSGLHRRKRRKTVKRLKKTRKVTKKKKKTTKSAVKRKKATRRKLDIFD